MGAYLDYKSMFSYLDKNAKSYFTGMADGNVIISNSSIDSVAAVNFLLGNGRHVGFITDGEYIGSFVCSYSDYTTIGSKFIISVVGVKNVTFTAYLLSTPIVFVTGASSELSAAGFVGNKQITESRYYKDDISALRMMGFFITDQLKDATVIIGGTELNNNETLFVKSGVPYHGYGADAIDDEFIVSLVNRCFLFNIIFYVVFCN